LGVNGKVIVFRNFNAYSYVKSEGASYVRQAGIDKPPPTSWRTPRRRRPSPLRRRAVKPARAANHAHAGATTMTSAVARRLESLRTKGAIKDIEVANLLGTRPETVSRWNQGRAYPRANTEKTLLELEYIIDQLADFYEPNEARQWIFAPQRLLGGVSPAGLIRTGRIDEVMRLVGQLRDAVHL
jgi:DNA-binding transcriptional regulator YiaG